MAEGRLDGAVQPCRSAEQLLSDAVEKANDIANNIRAVRGDVHWFVCDQCGELLLGDAEYMVTSKHGYERPFCPKCIYTCKYCKIEYVIPMAYIHESCKQQYENEQRKRKRRREFKKAKKTKYLSGDAKIVKLTFDEDCKEMAPCKHNIYLTFSDGTRRIAEDVCSTEIAKIITGPDPPEIDWGEWHSTHFIESSDSDE